MRMKGKIVKKICVLLVMMFILISSNSLTGYVASTNDSCYKNVQIEFKKSSTNHTTLKTVIVDVPRDGEYLEVILGNEYFEAEDEELGKFIGWQNFDTGEIYTDEILFKANQNDDNIWVWPVFEKQRVTFSKTYLDNEGKLTGGSTEYICKYDITYGDFIKLAGVPETNSKYSFEGWRLSNSCKEEDVVKDSYVGLEAMYDKYPVVVNLAYLDEEGKLKTINETRDFETGTSLQDIVDEYEKELGDSVVSKINYWSPITWRGINLEQEVDINYTFLDLAATYDDKQIIGYYFGYITDSENSETYGEENSILEFSVIDKEDSISGSQMMSAIEKQIIHKHYDALTYVGIDYMYDWEYNEDFNNDGYYDYSQYKSVYDNILVKLDYNHDNLGEKVYVVKPGDTLSLDTEYDGKKVKCWEDYNHALTPYNDVFIVPDDAVNGEIYRLTIQLSDQISSGDELTPSLKLEESKIEEVKTEIQELINSTTASETPSKLVVDMKKEDGSVATVVPKQILEAVQGENIDIVLDMGDYTWTINGESVDASVLNDINLEVKLNTKNIPSQKVEELAGGQDTYQISLTHEGDFGFNADLTINVGKEHEGKSGSLYYYNLDGKLEYMNAGKIDADGNVSLLFSHASDYVVVISEATNEEIKDTGDNYVGIFFVGLMILGMGMVVVAGKRRVVR